jgi:hypothetical protein
MSELSGQQACNLGRQLYQSTDAAGIEEALTYITPDLKRDEWAQVLMAIQHELGEGGKSIADYWSSGGQSYTEKAFREAWRSCKQHGNQKGTVTIATLFHLAKQGGYKPHKNNLPYQQSPTPKKPPAPPPDAAKQREKAIEKANVLWAKGTPAIEHPYTQKKGLEPVGLRVLGDGLLIPMRDADRQLVSIQTINKGGRKLFLKGCPTSGLYHAIGKPKDNTLIVCEGWATGQSIHMATRLAVAVAFSSGNLNNVAQILKEKNPGYKIVIAPDNDESRHAIDIAESGARQYDCQVVIPQFPEDTNGTDFDDLRQTVSLEEVKRQIMNCRYQLTSENVEANPVQRAEQAIHWPDYPLEALGPVLSQAALAIAQTVQTPLHLSGQSVLAAAALAVQALANVQIDNRVHPLSLFCLTVGESGERKSGADYLALKPHREWERQQHKAAKEEIELYQNELDTWKRDRQVALKKGGHGLDGFKPEPAPPVQPVFICEEPTLEGLQKSFRFGLPSQGLYSDEGGQFFGGHAMNPDNALKTMAGLSKFWDGSPIKRTRAANGESWAGFNRRLSCHLLTQPIVASGVLTDQLMQQQGILARFLIASGDHRFGQRPYHRPSSDDLTAIENYQAAITVLLEKPWVEDEDGGLILTTIRPSQDAMNLWITAYNAIEGELADGGEYQAIRPAASKAAENIARIAGVLAAFAGQSQIDAATMQNAIQLGDYYLEQYRLNTRSGKNHIAEDKAQKLLTWLKSRNTPTIDVDTISTNAPNTTGAHGSVDRTRAMMQRLADTDSVLCTKLNNQNRPSEWKIS